MHHYDRIAKAYFERRRDPKRFNYNRLIEVPAMLKLIGNVKNKTVLDLGCGFGDHMQKLSSKKPKQMIGLDLSAEQIRLAQSMNVLKATFLVKDINKRLDFKDNTFDIVFSSLTVHYLHNLNKVFGEVRRVLKSKGIFVFSTGHPIFNLLNPVGRGMIGFERKGNKLVIHGNYFDESLKKAFLGSTVGTVRLHNYTIQTYIQTAQKKGLALVDFVEAKPSPASKKIDEQHYRKCTTLPTFMLFKFRKQ
jgi:SAM-dependent methyltransferase